MSTYDRKEERKKLTKVQPQRSNARAEGLAAFENRRTQAVLQGKIMAQPDGRSQSLQTASVQHMADVGGSQAQQQVAQAAAMIQHAAAEGAAGDPIQMATKVHYYTQNVRGSNLMPVLRVGRNTHAELDVEDPIKGSTPGGSVDHDALMLRLNQTYPGSGFLRGHLLNDNLGGLGIWDNMFPITKNANVHHLEGAERQVKQSILDATENDQSLSADIQAVEDALWDAGDEDFVSEEYFEPDGQGGLGDRNDDAIPDEWLPKHIIDYDIQAQPDAPNALVQDPSSYILCQWETINTSAKKLPSLSPEGEHLTGQEQIRSAPGVTTGQNAALDDAGWGSTGSGYRGGHDAVVEGAEQDLEGLDGYRGRPLSNNGTIYAYRVTQEPD